MNFLAHAYLSPSNARVQIGNLLGDTVKGRVMSGVGPAVREGVMLHRRIDMFTDAHPEIAILVELFRPQLGRFSPIAVDVILDHFLAKNWEKFAPIPLANFVQVLFRSFHQISAELPQRTKWLGTVMDQRGWLLEYQTLNGLEHILRQMSQRIDNRVELYTVIPTLELNYQRVYTHFELFFSELQTEFSPDWKKDERFTL